MAKSKSETRRRFTGYGPGGDGAPSTHDPEFIAAFKAWRHGTGPEPDSEEFDVVEIDTISGPRRVWADRVDEYEEVLES